MLGDGPFCALNDGDIIMARLRFIKGAFQILRNYGMPPISSEVNKTFTFDSHGSPREYLSIRDRDINTLQTTIKWIIQLQ